VIESPIDKIKRGITESDWSLVSDALFALTGERVEPVQPDPDKALIALIDQRVRQHYYSSNPQPVPTPQPPVSDPDPEPEPDEPEPAPEAFPAKPAKAGGDALIDQFRIEHKGPTGEGEGTSDGKRARAVPWKKPDGPNKFTPATASDPLADQLVAQSKSFSSKSTPQPRRETPQLVKAKCCKCEHSYLVDPLFQPRKLGDDDEGTSYVCDKCMGRGRRGSPE
jgi:hypothetical protein